MRSKLNIKPLSMMNGLGFGSIGVGMNLLKMSMKLNKEEQ